MGMRTACRPFWSRRTCLKPPLQPHRHAVICDPHEWVAVGSGLHAFRTYLLTPPFWHANRSNSKGSSWIWFMTWSGASNILEIKCMIDGWKRSFGISGIDEIARAGCERTAHHLFRIAGQIESNCKTFCWRLKPVVLQNSERTLWTHVESLAAGVHSKMTIAAWLRYAIRRVPVSELDLSSLFSLRSPK